MTRRMEQDPASSSWAGRPPPEGRHQSRRAACRTVFPTAALARRLRKTPLPPCRGHGGGRPRAPVIEFMYPDFMWVAADQVFNQIGKFRHMFGGESPMPSSCALLSPWARATARSIRWTRRASSPPPRLAHRRALDAFDYVGLMNSALRLTTRCWCWNMSIFTPRRASRRPRILTTASRWARRASCGRAAA